MLREYFEAGGPLMYAVLCAWVVVLAGVLDRGLYAAGRALRRPGQKVRTLLVQGRRGDARTALLDERRRAERGTERLDSVSQLATSIGLFGTVVGLASAFFSQVENLELATREVLAGGLATALFTTVAGLVVFLFGQAFLIVYREWLDYCERGFEQLLEGANG